MGHALSLVDHYHDPACNSTDPYGGIVSIMRDPALVTAQPHDAQDLQQFYGQDPAQLFGHGVLVDFYPPTISNPGVGPHHITATGEIWNPPTHAAATYSLALIAQELVDVGFDIFGCTYAEDVRDNIVLQPGQSAQFTLACDLQHCPWGNHFGLTFVGLHERSPHVLNYYRQTPYTGFD